MSESIIRIDNVVKTFNVGMENELEILHKICIEIKEGEFVSIVGSSGAGKSTLMNIIGLLDKPTEGKYILNSIDTSNMKDDELSEIRNSQIGFVFQTFNLIPRMSALKNVELPMMYKGIPQKERTTKAKKLLEMVGMGDRMSHQPNQLSGGQKQRVSIARAMANDPAIILADEPTGNLNFAIGEEVIKQLCEVSEGKTLIAVTHDDRLAKYFDIVIDMNEVTCGMRDSVDEKEGE